MKKKSFLTLCILFVVICALGLTACSGSYAMIDLAVNSKQLDNEYEVGDIVDLSKLAITAKFNDDSEEAIPLDKVTIFLDGKEIGLDEVSKITETVGTKLLEIKYSNFVKSIQITVKEKYVPTLTGVEMDAANVTKAYVIGDDVSMAGLKIYAVYDNGSLKEEVNLSDENVTVFMDEEIVTGNYNRITQEIGTKNIKVKYTVFNTENTFAITVSDVKDRVVVSLPENFKTTYKVGEAISVTGITAKAEYRSGRKEIIDEIKYYIGTEEVNFSALTETKGSKTIVAKAVSGDLKGEREITFTVENHINAISLDTEGAILTFTTDDELSIETFNAVKVNVTYADTQDNTQIGLDADGVACLNVAGEAVVFSDLTNTAGDKVITVAYEGKATSFTVKVTDGETALEELTITSPTKTGYIAGEENVTLAGLVITAKYKEEYGKEDKTIDVANFATNDVNVYFNDKLVTDYNDLTKVSTLGVNQIFSVDVRYEGKTASFNITVTNEVVSLNANAANAKTTYDLEEDVDFSGLVVTATLNYGSKTVDNSDLSFFDGETLVTDLNTFTSAVNDEKDVTVSFGGQSATFTIQVNDVLLSISFGSKTTFTTYVNTAVNSVYSFDDLEVYGEYKSGAHTPIENGYTFSNNSITVPTSGRTVTVTYEGKTGEVTLVVVNYLASLSVENVPTLVQGVSVFQKLKNIIVLGTYAYGSGVNNLPLLQESGDAFLYGTVYFALKTGENAYTRYTQLELDNIASGTPGMRMLRLEYVLNDRSVYCEFGIEVAAASSGINEFSKPESIVLYEETLAKARKEDKTEKEFEGSFFSNNEEAYLVGDDNPYKFVPVLSQPNLETEEITTLETYRTDSTVYYNNTELTSSMSGNIKSFYLNNQLMVEVDVTQNTFDFTEEAIDKSFTLSVLPSHEQFDFNDGEFEPVEWTVKITDGYNITDPKELCLLEQSNRHFWDDIKEELGLDKLTTQPEAIILHQNTVITRDSIPSLFYYTLASTSDIKYKYTDGENKTVTCAPEEVPAEYGGGNLDRTFLLDEEYALFEYNMQSGHSFTIHGNFFDIDLSSLPLVAAFEQSEFNPHNNNDYNLIASYYGSDLGTYYGEYMSKVSFLEVHGVEDTLDDKDETFSFSNFAVKGNVNINQLLVADTDYITAGIDNPVFGGGIIFVKTEYCKANIENIHAHACFIPFYSRNETVVNYTNVKAYDSFLNGLFVNSDSVNTLTNCHMKRAGGPLILLVQGSRDGENNTKIPLVPEVYADSDCEFENFVTGQEQWFVINGADVSTLAAPAAALQYFGKTIQKDGKYNLITLSIEEGKGPFTSSFDTQANMTYYKDDEANIYGKLDRLARSEIFDKVTTYIDTVYTNTNNISIVFSVGDYMFGPTDSGLLDENLQNIMTDNSDYHVAIQNAFSGTQYKYTAIHVGGMGLLTELFPVS